jgi:hypothetical protein
LKPFRFDAQIGKFFFRGGDDEANRFRRAQCFLGPIQARLAGDEPRHPAIVRDMGDLIREQHFVDGDEDTARPADREDGQRLPRRWLHVDADAVSPPIPSSRNRREPHTRPRFLDS